MKYSIYTLGCKVNQFETQAMETILKSHGHIPVSKGADAVIVNTCAVTAESGRKSRQIIRRLKSENPDAVIAVCGCYSQISPEDVQNLGVDILFGSGSRLELLSALEKRVLESAGQGICAKIDDPFQRREFEVLPAGSLSGRTRAMLKIEDGCDNFCTYCVIPYARGRVRSLHPETAAQMAAELEGEGYSEIIITGIEISSYGKDLRIDGKKLTLADAIEAISKAAPKTRLRLGSLEPTIVTEEFCKRLAQLGNICDHFHLSLQSGCDRTLSNMHRKYDTTAFFEAAQRLRMAFPDCALTADLITGFPGETEEEHMQTKAFIEKCGFADMHVFPYSERPGTPAAEMPGRVNKALRESRAREIQNIADTMKREFLEQCVGKTLSVLFETEDNGISFGHAENYCLVQTEATGFHGIVKNVKIIDVLKGNLVGFIV